MTKLITALMIFYFILFFKILFFWIYLANWTKKNLLCILYYI